MLPPTLRRTPRAFPLALGVATIALGACSGGDDTVTPTTSVSATTTTTIARVDDGVLKIGIYLPQTGPGASLGEPMVAAAVAAIDEINAAGGVLGHDIDHVIVDEGSSTDPIELLDAGVDAIVGPASSRRALSQLGSITRPDTGVVTCSPTATALALDAYPDKGFFFRTAPSDSLQMTAIARQAERTGVTSVAIGFLDDPYGRGLADALVDEIDSPRQSLVAEVSFDADQEDLSTVADELLAADPGVIVVLADADAGGRLLTALDVASADAPPQIIINDSIRAAPSIQQLSPGFRSRLTGVAPLASTDEAPEAFTAHTIDCVNLIALAASEAESAVPSVFKIQMAPVSGGGRQCTAFETCIALLEQGLQIDYNGLSGNIELSSTTGDPTQATFVTFGFDADGSEIDQRSFSVP